MKRNWTIARKTLGVALVAAGLAWGFAQLGGDTWRAHAAAQVSSSQAASQADAPNFQNAKVEARTLQGSLNEEARRWAEGASKARWLGYAVTGVKGSRSICCSDYNGSDRCGRCALEGHRSGVSIEPSDEKTGRVRLEGSPQMAVMYRAEGGKIGRVRIFSLQCTVDAGGLNVLWLEGVNATESVKVLEKFVTNGEAAGDEHESIGKSALTALALHGDPSADGALESFVSPNRPEWLRRETAFWLGEARGAGGLRTLEKMAKTDPSPHVREQVAFALSVSSEPGALTEMIRMAREDSDGHVRGQALFWLAQKAGKKAESAITGAIQNDPDTEVKKKAVFALSQMPQDEGVPKLIEVATTNRNPEVRKQAMFWLGQSDDPRALEFFEKVLSQ
jgi:HEAT repeats